VNYPRLVDYRNKVVPVYNYTNN